MDTTKRRLKKERFRERERSWDDKGFNSLYPASFAVRLVYLNSGAGCEAVLVVTVAITQNVASPLITISHHTFTPQPFTLLPSFTQTLLIPVKISLFAPSFTNFPHGFFISPVPFFSLNIKKLGEIPFCQYEMFLFFLQKI